jgi:hypothetical protein
LLLLLLLSIREKRKTMRAQAKHEWT